MAPWELGVDLPPNSGACHATGHKLTVEVNSLMKVQWCLEEKTSPSFSTEQLEVLVLVYMRSLQLASFKMHLDAQTELAPWFHALYCNNYARWIPVHLGDMAELPTKHPDVARKFRAGSFTIQKTKKVFSTITIDQAHEPDNACIKGDGGAVGLTDNPSALLRWMVARPEVVKAIEEFQDGDEHWGRRVDTRHHDQTPSVQTSFAKDVCSLVSVIEELSNTSEEDRLDLVVLDTNKMACPAAIKSVRNVKMIGQEFQAFTRELLVEETKPI